MATRSPSHSHALAKRSADTTLMPPPPAPKRIKRPSQVVDEDVYTEALSHIIARDFFPGLVESHAQSEYLEALDSKNNEWIREAGRKLHQAMTPGPGGRGRRGTSIATPSQTPRAWQGATPSRTPSVAASTRDGPPKPPLDASLSLGAFQAKYTSEDNESFNTLLDKQNHSRAQKYAFLYHGNKLPSKQQIAQQKIMARNASTSQSTALLPLRPSQDLDRRPATFDTFPDHSGPRNTLMYAPDGVEDTHETVAQKAQALSTAPPRSVSYSATRLPVPASEAPVPESPSLSAVDAAIAGRPRPTSTDPGYGGAETPRVNGYAFVDAEPRPHELGEPVADAEAEAEERRAAMALMPSFDAAAAHNPFRLQAQSRREDIHHRMVDKSNAQRRPQQRASVARTPAPAGRTPARQVGSLTPAARLLAQRIGGGAKSDGVFGGMTPKGRKVATPAPTVKKQTTRSGGD